MEIQAAEREAFLRFLELNTALSSIDDSLLAEPANDRVILIDLLSHHFNTALRALYIGRVLRNLKGYRLVGLTGNLLLSKSLKFPFSRENILAFARSYGVTEFLDLEEILTRNAPLAGGFAPADTEAALLQARNCDDETLADVVLSWKAPDGTRIGEYIHDTALRISRNPVLAETPDIVEQVTQEAHAIYNAIDAFCRDQKVEAFVAGHMIYTQWGAVADMVLRRNGKAIWFDHVGSFSAYLMDRAPVGAETLCGLIRKIDQPIFEKMFAERDRFDARLVEKVGHLFLSDQFLTPHWWRTTKTPAKPLLPLLRRVALKKLGWDERDGRPVICVFLHCFADSPRDDEQVYRDYLVWLVETLKIAAGDPTKRWIFKSHPANKGTYDITNKMQLIEAEYTDKPHIRFLDNELHKSEVIALCDLAITVRGSVSYEFSMLGTPTLVAGRSFQSDIGFCHIADSAANYEALLTKHFDELGFTQEMRERVDFYIFYDRAICRIESTLIPYWSLSKPEGAVWQDLCERIAHNINDLDPVVAAIRNMWEGAPCRTLNPRFSETTSRPARRSAHASQDVARYSLGDTLSFGRDGHGAGVQLSSNTEIEAAGRWFPADRDALIGLILDSVPSGTEPLSLRLEFAVRAEGMLNVCVNGQPLPQSPTAAAESQVVELVLPRELVGENALVLEIALLDPKGRRLPLRIDSLRVDPSPASARKAVAGGLSRIVRVSRTIDLHGLLGGSYPVEDTGESPFVWVRRNAQFAARLNAASRYIRVAGYIPFAMHKDRNGISQFQIVISANGRVIGEIHAKDNQPFEHVIDAASVPLNSDGVVSIDFAANSELAATPADQRELSYIVTKIAVE